MLNLPRKRLQGWTKLVFRDIWVYGSWTRVNDLFVVEEMQAFSGRNMRTRSKADGVCKDRNQPPFL